MADLRFGRGRLSPFISDTVHGRPSLFGANGPGLESPLRRCQANAASAGCETGPAPVQDRRHRPPCRSCGPSRGPQRCPVLAGKRCPNQSASRRAVRRRTRPAPRSRLETPPALSKLWPIALATIPFRPRAGIFHPCTDDAGPTVNPRGARRPSMSGGRCHPADAQHTFGCPPGFRFRTCFRFAPVGISAHEALPSPGRS
jgi:hypothetical protein